MPRARPPATRFRIRSSASTRSRPTTCPRSSPPSAPAASGRTSSRAASGRWPGAPGSRTTGSPSRGSARPRPTSRRRRGPRRQANRCAGWPSSRRRKRRLSPRPFAAPEPGPWTSCTGSIRMSTPETHAGLAVGGGATKFGMTETEIGTAITAGGGPDGPLRPRGIHLHVGSQLGAVDAWRDAVRKALALAALWRGSIETFDTVDLGGGFPVRPDGEPSPDPERFARELPGLLDGVPADRRPTRLAIEPGRLAGGAGRLARGPGPARPRSGWSPGHPRRRHDRAHPARAVRSAPPSPRPDIARAVARPGDGADPGRGADLRVHGHAGHPRPAGTPPRRPRRHRRCGCLRGVAGIRPTTAGHGRRR